MQEHSKPSVKVCLAIEAARLAAEWNVVGSNKRSRSLSSFASEEGAVGRRSVRRRKVGKGGELRNGDVQDDGGTKAGCHKPDAVSRFARKAEGSSESDNPDGVSARET